MRILILANNDVGLYQFRKELLETLSRNNKVFVSCPYGDLIDKIKATGCKYIRQEFERRGTNPLSDLKLLRSYVRLIKKVHPDAVLTYTIKPNVYGGLACQLTRTPYLANVTGLGTSIENGGLMKVLTTNLYKLGLRKASCVFFQNKVNRNIFIRNKLVKRHTRLIPGSGVNLSNHTFEPYPDEENGLRFLFVGRLMKDKGIEELIGAMKMLHKDYPFISLDIIGDYDEDYTALIENAEKGGYVRYHGRQDNVHEFYKNCHCVVLPSYHEGMANVLLEGASTGRPVVASNIPGCRETFNDGKTGFGCKVKDTESLAAAMKKFIEVPHEEKAAMGAAGREKVKKEFDRSIIVRAYLDELSKITKK